MRAAKRVVGRIKFDPTRARQVNFGPSVPVAHTQENVPIPRLAEVSKVLPDTEEVRALYIQMEGMNS